MGASKMLQNMRKLDDSWNAQDLDTFRRYHAKDCIVRWPNQLPTHGREAHERGAIAFFEIFLDQHLTTRSCWRKGNGHAPLRTSPGTMKGAMTMRDGTAVRLRTKASI